MVIGLTPAGAEDGVRTHFEKRVHTRVSLAGFTISGPAITWSVDDVLASDLAHAHGWCSECKAHRASRFCSAGAQVAFCPVCNADLVEPTFHEPHPEIESVEAG